MNSPQGGRVVLNVGCGPLKPNALPAFFDDWNTVRVDIDPAVQPDVLADLTDLSPIADGTAHAIWASHCLEHLYEYQIPLALNEFRRVLHYDGFLCLLVPDLQTVANYMVADRMHEPLYESNSGPVTAHDIVFGFGVAIERGSTAMAHRCGFTPSLLQRAFAPIGYGEVLLRRRSASLELVAVARARPARDQAEREALLAALEL